LHPSDKSFPEWQKNTSLNSYNICKSCRGEITHLQFREQQYRDLAVLFNEACSEVHGVTKHCPSNSETQTFLALAVKGKRVPVTCAKRSKIKNIVLNMSGICILKHAPSYGTPNPISDCNSLLMPTVMSLLYDLCSKTETSFLGLWCVV
jgi:hypothetical protein